MHRCNLFAWVLTVATFTAHSLGSPPRSTGKGAVRWAEEGMVAYRAGQWEQARLALKQAFDQDPQTITAFNLSLAEVKTDHWVDAARHLAYYIRYESDVKPKERELLVEIEKRVAMLEVNVNVDGATIQVDSESVGQWPLPVQPIYILPGRHTVRADKSGFISSAQSLDFPIGVRTRCELTLPPTPSSDPTNPPPRELVPTPGSASSPAARPEPPPQKTAAEFRTAAWMTGGGLTLVAVGIGVGFAIDGMLASNSRDQLLTQIREHYGAVGCPAFGASLAACSDVLSEENRRNNSNTAANWAFAAGGLLAAATTTVFLLWPGTERTPGATKVSVAPARGGAELSIHGEF